MLTEYLHTTNNSKLNTLNHFVVFKKDCTFVAVKRIGAFILLCLSAVVWLFSLIISLPFVLFHWLKRIFVKSK